MKEISEVKKNLIIILAETRSSELTFLNFKKNVYDVLDADLCVCIGVKADYDYNDPFYQLAKYRFIFDDKPDYAEYVDNLNNEIRDSEILKYDLFENYSPIQSIIKYNLYENTNRIAKFDYLGKIQLPFKPEDINKYSDIYDDIVIYNDKHDIIKNRNDIFGIQYGNEMKDTINNLKLIENYENVITFKKKFHWRKFLNITDQWLGGIKSHENEYQHPGSGGILLVTRSILLSNLINNNLIEKYERFVITRSDYIYRLPHPKLEDLDLKHIWIPDGESYGGFTDRHVILSRDNITTYLNILNNLILEPNIYLGFLMGHYNWNLEKIIGMHLFKNFVQNKVEIREIPYIMYTVRSPNGSTATWSLGTYSEKHGYCIKYQSEYQKSKYYKKLFKNKNVDIDTFYKILLKEINIEVINIQKNNPLRYYFKDLIFNK